jgi:hypothetical protein
MAEEIPERLDSMIWLGLAEVNREVEVCLLWIVLSLRLLTDDIPF